ncbi:MAG: hypothetical protein JW703_05635 [Candidatus Diapherotrites archaeon]|nr:hypothetical protein [Candidatus Diapherotrites archaeon]
MKTHSVWTVSKIAEKLRNARKLNKCTNKWMCDVAQFFFRIPSIELKKTLTEFGLTPKETKSKPILIVAGFNARLAKKISEAGYRILFTDANPEFVEKAKRKSIDSIQLNAEKIDSELKKQGKKTEEFSAIMSFEPFPLKEKNLLSTALKTNHGLIIIQEIDYTEGTGNYNMLRNYSAIMSYFKNISIKRKELTQKDGRKYLMFQIKRD